MDYWNTWCTWNYKVCVGRWFWKGGRARGEWATWWIRQWCWWKGILPSQSEWFFKYCFPFLSFFQKFHCILVLLINLWIFYRIIAMKEALQGKGIGIEDVTAADTGKWLAHFDSWFLIKCCEWMLEEHSSSSNSWFHIFYQRIFCIQLILASLWVNKMLEEMCIWMQLNIVMEIKMVAMKIWWNITGTTLFIYFIVELHWALELNIEVLFHIFGSPLRVDVEVSNQCI